MPRAKNLYNENGTEKIVIPLYSVLFQTYYRIFVVEKVEYGEILFAAEKQINKIHDLQKKTINVIFGCS